MKKKTQEKGFKKILQILEKFKDVRKKMMWKLIFVKFSFCKTSNSKVFSLAKKEQFDTVTHYYKHLCKD